MGPTWGRQDPGGTHVGPMNFAIWVVYSNQWNGPFVIYRPYFEVSEYPIIKIKWSNEYFIFILVNHTLVRWHLCVETTPLETTPFSWHGKTLILEGIVIATIIYKVWDEIVSSFPNFNAQAIEVLNVEVISSNTLWMYNYLSMVISNLMDISKGDSRLLNTMQQ